MALVGPPMVAASIGEELDGRGARRPEVLDRRERQRARRRRRRGRGARRAQAGALVPSRLGRAARAGGGAGRAGAARRGAAHARAERPAPRLRHAPRARGDLRRRQLLPWKERYGASLLCSLARLEGSRSAWSRASRCSAPASSTCPRWRRRRSSPTSATRFNLPLVFLQDVPGPDGRLRRRARRHPPAVRGGRRHASRGCASRRSRSSCGRPTAAATSRSPGGRPTPTCARLADAELGFMAPTPASRSSTSAGSRRRSPSEGEEAHDAARRRARAEEWARESEPWEAAAHIYSTT